MKKFKYIFLTMVLASVATMISGGQMFGDDQQVKPLAVYSLHSEHGELIPVSQSKYSIKLFNGVSEVSEVIEPKYVNEFLHFVGMANESSAFQITYDGNDASDVYELGETITEYYNSEDYTYQRGQILANRKVSLKNAPVEKCLFSLDFGFNERDSLLIRFDTGSRHSDDL